MMPRMPPRLNHQMTNNNNPQQMAQAVFLQQNHPHNVQAQRHQVMTGQPMQNLPSVNVGNQHNGAARMIRMVQPSAQPMGPGVPAQMPGPSQPLPQHPQQPPGQQQQHPQQRPHTRAEDLKEVDPVIKAKNMMPQLRESLVNLMQAASQTFSANLAVDEVKKTMSDPGSAPKLEKCIEHFMSLSDQLDQYLRLVLEQNMQVVHNHTLPPNLQNLNLLRPEQNGSETFNTCQMILEQQRSYVTNFHEVMANFCRKTNEKKSIRMRQQQMQQQQQHQQQQQRQQNQII